MIRLKATWTEPAIIWAAIVGKSGTHKTPALQAALKFIEKRQSKSIADYEVKLTDYEQERQQYDKAFATWKTKGSGLPPLKPEEPACNRYVTNDSTIEALTALLDAQFDGLLVCRDELSGWLNGIGEYKSSKGSDLGHWLACWSAAPLTVDRKTGDKKMLHVPRAAVSLVGGIQPDVMRKAIAQEHMQNGLCARLLLSMPCQRPVVWSEKTVESSVEEAMETVFDGICDLAPEFDETGNIVPRPLDLTPEAKVIWVEYFNRHRAELVDRDDDLAAAWSKLEAYAARLALIFQLCAYASNDASGDAVNKNSMRAAIELADWFGNEAESVYGMFVEDQGKREQRELVEWIMRRGGETSAHDLYHGVRRFRGKSSEAEAALNDLVKAGLGNWHTLPPGDEGGRAKMVFRLVDSVTVTTTHRNP